MGSRFLPFCLWLTLGFSAPWAAAHQEHDDEDELMANKKMMEQIIEFTPGILVDENESRAGSPVWKVGHYWVKVDGPFWKLVQSWIRLYIEELHGHESDGSHHHHHNYHDHAVEGGGFNQTSIHSHSACTSTNAPQSYTQDQLLYRSPDDVKVRSFLERQLDGPLKEAVEHIVLDTADLGSRLGKEAFVAKLTAEVAEGIGSKLIGGFGVHLFCSAIDAAIIFGTRHLQTAYRTNSWSSQFNRSGMVNLMRLGMLKGAIKKAQRKVSFVGLGPVEIDEEEIREIDGEGDRRFWGWVNEGKRARWLRKIHKKLVKGYDESSVTSLDQDTYLGKRQKRYLLLKRRRLGHSKHLRGNTSIDQVLNKPVLWVFAVQEGLLNRGFKHDRNLTQVTASSTNTIENAAKYRTLVDRFAALEDSARRHLATDSDFPEELLKEIEVVFNTQAPSHVRLAQVELLEQLWMGFIYSAFRKQLSFHTEEIYGESWSAIWKRFNVHFRAGGFTRYIYEWADFLRIIALEKDPERIFMARYEAMGSFIRFTKHLSHAKDLFEARDALTFELAKKQFLESERRLNTFKPWREKKSHSVLFPWSESRPLCEELAHAN